MQLIKVVRRLHSTVHGETVLEIKQKDLTEMEMLLNQSVKGHHFLFDHRKIAQILKTPTEEINFFSKENIDHIQKLLTGLLSQKSFYKKQSYLNSLDHRNFEILVRLYFHILDSTVMASLKSTH